MQVRLFVILLISLIVVYHTNQKIQVISVPDKYEKYLDSIGSDIKNSLANYGDIPYGAKYQGVLRVADPIDGCSYKNVEDVVIDGERNQKKTEEQKKKEKKKDQENLILLIERGNCHFTKKSLFAEQQNAKLAIIVDNIEGEEISNIIMRDDGFGDNVNIPTILVDYSQGTKLIDLVTQVQYDEREDQEVRLMVDLTDFFKKSKNVDVKFFVNPPLAANFELINNFFRQYSAVKQNLQFTPVYDFYQGWGDPQDPNCIRGGRYCGYDMDGDQAGTGRHVIEDYLKQICINQHMGAYSWYQYVYTQHHECEQIFNWDICSIQQTVADKQFKALYDKKKEKIQKCIEADGGLDNDKPLDVLEQQLEIRYLSNVMYYPAVTINQQKYKGSINGLNVMEATCNALKDPSPKCKEIMNKQIRQIVKDGNKTSNGPQVGIIIGVVGVVLVLFFFFMLFFYRRITYVELRKNMSQEVNQMVSQYVAFHENSQQNTSKVMDQENQQLED